MRKCLPNGYELKSKNKLYKINDVIGMGSSCIVYSAEDEEYLTKCIIKEFYPASIPSTRNQRYEIIHDEKHEIKYLERKERFTQATKTQISIRNEGEVVNNSFYIYDLFSVNNTEYVVVPEYHGRTYDKNADMSLYDRIRVCKSVAEFVLKCHNKGYLCLDIKPQNIFVIPETPELTLFFDYDSFKRIDELVFGCITSYTEKWAAPEQLSPCMVKDLSARTDIYAIGELLFWSIFDRNSVPQEHRGYSEFDYSGSICGKELRSEARKKLTEIFHKTIRSSINNRYKNMEELIQNLSDLVLLVAPIENEIIPTLPDLPDLIGREKEINQIKQGFEKNKVQFVYGIGGIGKSFVAKKYAYSRIYDYDYIVFLRFYGNIIETVNNNDFLTNIEKYEKESSEEYCLRRLSKLRKIISENSLIIVDGMDVNIDELSDFLIWEKFTSIGCNILLTTRSFQSSYADRQITINPLEQEQLRELFHKNSPYSNDQQKYVDQIIDLVDRHTLFIELLSKQAKIRGYSPSSLYEEIEKTGMTGFKKDLIPWNGNNQSLFSYVELIFRLSGLSESQEITLRKIALLPAKGADKGIFIDAFSITDVNELQDLIDKGIIKESLSNHFVSIHSLLSDYLINIGINKDDYKLVMDELCENIKNHDTFSSKSEEYILFMRDVARRIVQISENYREYIISFLWCCLSKLTLSDELAVAIYDKIIALWEKLDDEDRKSIFNEYVENAYLWMVSDFDLAEDNSEKAVATCKDHINNAKKHNNFIYSDLWKVLLCVIRIRLMDGFRAVSAYFTLLTLPKKYVNAMYYHYNRYNKYHESNDEVECKKNIEIIYRLTDYINSIGRNMYTIDKMTAKALEVSNRFSSCVEIFDRKTQRTKIQSVINSAYIYKEKNDIDSAIKVLEETLEAYDCRELIEGNDYLDMCFLIAHLYAINKQYNEAIQCYEKIETIVNKFGYNKYTAIEIGEVLTLAGRYEEAENRNREFLEMLNSDYDDKEGGNFGRLIVHYNMALNNYKQGNIREAFESLNEAFDYGIKGLVNCRDYSLRRDAWYLLARCSELIGDIEDEDEYRIKNYSYSLRFYKNCGMKNNNPIIRQLKKKMK